VRLTGPFLLWTYITAQAALGLLLEGMGGKWGGYIAQIAVPWTITLTIAALQSSRQREMRVQFVFPRAAAWILLYLTWAGVSILWSDPPNYSFVIVTWATYGVLCVAVALTMHTSRESAIVASLWGIVAGGCFTAVYYVGFSGLAPDSSAMRVTTSEISYWNGLGAATGMASVAAVSLLSRRRGRHATLLAIVFPLLAGVTIVTVSKTAIVATGAAVVAFSLANRTKLRKKAVVFTVAIASMLVAVPYAIPILQTYGQNQQNIDTLTGRTELWAQISRLIGEAPIAGHGFMWIAFHKPEEWAGEAHNDVLQQLLNFGAIGLAVAVTVYWRLGRRIIKDRGQFRAFAIAMFVFCLFRGVTEATDTLILPLHLALLLIYATEVHGPSELRFPEQKLARDRLSVSAETIQ
jgi:O-antigen ligase